MRMKRTGLGLVVVVLLLLARALSPGADEPEEVSITRANAEADAFVDPARPARNYGILKDLRLGGDPGRHAFVRFGVRGLSGRVVRATLWIHAIDGAGGGYRVHGVTGGWAETRITHRNAPPARSSIGRSGGFKVGALTQVDVTSLISGNGTFSLMLSSRSARTIRLSSRESGRPPLLVIETVPLTDPVVMAAGRIACDPRDGRFNGGKGTARACRMRATSNLLVWNRPFLSAVLPLGDLQYQDGAAEKYADSYDPTWGRVKDLSRPVPGNHDYKSPGASGYFTYFAGVTAAPAYYSFGVGAWHLIALNSECAEIGGCGRGSPQEVWLRADLAASSASCTLAYWHRPRFSSGVRGGDEEIAPLWDALHEGGADIVLNAHERFYERFVPQDPDGRLDLDHGIAQFNVGTGGKGALQGWPTVRPNSVSRSRTTLGVLELTLKKDGYDWRFVPETGQRIIDRGTGSCHGPPEL